MQPGYKNGNWHRKIFHSHNEKRKKRYNGKDRTAKSRQNQYTWRKGKLPYLPTPPLGQDATQGQFLSGV